MHNSFTLSAPGILRSLITKAVIAAAFDPNNPPNPPPKLCTFNAVWDTGATGSVISQRIVDACGLKPIGMVMVHTAGGECMSEVYLVSIILPNQVGFPNVKVTKGNMISAEMLIGMDIISQGDFAVTHKDGKTCFSFRVPSMERIDFVQAASVHGPAKSVPRVGRNDPCPCGSGKKFKKCCGKPS